MTRYDTIVLPASKSKFVRGAQRVFKSKSRHCAVKLIEDSQTLGSTSRLIMIQRNTVLWYLFFPLCSCDRTWSRRPSLRWGVRRKADALTSTGIVKFGTFLVGFSIAVVISCFFLYSFRFSFRRSYLSLSWFLLIPAYLHILCFHFSFLHSVAKQVQSLHISYPSGSSFLQYLI